MPRSLAVHREAIMRRDLARSFSDDRYGASASRMIRKKKKFDAGENARELRVAEHSEAARNLSMSLSQAG
jgi:hypothetical protein